MPKVYISRDDGLIDRLGAVFQNLDKTDETMLVMNEVIEGLLRGEADEKMRVGLLSKTADFFKVATVFNQSERTGFCLQVIRAILNERPGITSLRLSISGRVVRELERLGDLPPFLRPDEPTQIILPTLPAPTYHDNFESLLVSAIERRLLSALGFFHRRNPAISREVPIPVLLSPEFAEKMIEAVKTCIIPDILASRRMRLIAGGRRWGEIDSEAFWGEIAKTGDDAHLKRAWDSAWEDIFQPGADTPSKKAKKFRGVISFPFHDEEASLCRSLLCDMSPSEMEKVWTRMRQIYEQEMDRRIYQDRAREGAFRDAMLKLLDETPDRQGELLVLLSYWTFPRISIRFLAAFSHNKGTNPTARRERIPFLMEFLDHPALAGLMVVEDKRHAEERERIEEYRKKTTRERALYESRGLNWKNTAS